MSVSLPDRPIRTAAANDYDLVVAGVAALLEAFPDHIEVRDRVLVGEAVENGPIDVLLYDTYGRTGEAAEALQGFLAQADISYVAMFSMDLNETAMAEARAAGCRAFISKALPAEEIVAAVIAVAGGEEVVALPPAGAEPDPATLDVLTWPGQDEGLSQRESEVLVLAAEGLTNREIATTLYVGVETVKSHLANVFAKLGLRNRVEATRYVLETGTFARYAPAEQASNA